MMRSYKIDNTIWQIILSCQFYAFYHMIYYDFRTFPWCNFVMGIYIGNLVFGKVSGIIHLANIVIQRPYPYQHGIRPNFIGGRFRKVSHLQGVIEGSRGLVGKFLQQF